MTSTPPTPGKKQSFFSALTPGGERNLLDTLRAERTGGVLLMIGAVVGLVLANGPTREWFDTLSHTYLTVGPVELTVAHWAADGLLAIFFFVIGLELTREIQVGELRHLRTAVVPMVGAVGGMLVPAALYLAINAPAANGEVSGWAIPTATDIAFAVAVLALVAPGLPVAVRAFLLTLAVVDDLLAIIIIAVAYSDGVTWGWLALSLASVVAFALLLRSPLMRARATTVLLVAIAVLAWVAMLNAGVHATIAGVALGLVVPATARARAHARAGAAAGNDDAADDGHDSLAERFEHVWRPVSSGFAVPVFAVFTAGVVIEPELLAKTMTDPVAWGVLVGLVVGKPLGITAATWLLCRFTGAQLATGVRWRDISAVSCLAGIGFTVSLLIGSLAFGESDRASEVVIAVLVASLLAAAIGAIALRIVRPRASALLSST